MQDVRVEAKAGSGQYCYLLPHYQHSGVPYVSGAAGHPVAITRQAVIVFLLRDALQCKVRSCHSFKLIQDFVVGGCLLVAGGAHCAVKSTGLHRPNLN